MPPIRTDDPSPPRRRRQSGRVTRRELRQSLSGSARKWLKQVWAAAEEFTLRLSRLSPVTSPVGSRLLDEYMEEHELAGEALHRALFLALVAGYSTRTVLLEPTEQPGLDPASLDADHLDDRTRSIASHEFESVMTLPPEVWSGYVLTATTQIQGRHASPSLSWTQLGRERIETLLRYGYVLRCIDEALDAEPVFQDG